MNTGIIVQARLSSTRLPGKITMPVFKDMSVLDIIITRLKTIEFDLPIIIATGDLKQNDILLQYAEKHDVFFFSGEEHNVLKRFITCAEKFKLQKVLRICSDNPFLDIELAQNLISQSFTHHYDYISYQVNDKPAILSHYGFFSEIVTYDALVKAHLLSGNSSDREHVTPYIYNHPDSFSINLIEAPKEIAKENGIRLTVDTETDFKNVGAILKILLQKKENFSYTFRDVLSVVKNMSHTVKQNMIEQIIINSKS